MRRGFDLSPFALSAGTACIHVYNDRFDGDGSVGGYLHNLILSDSSVKTSKWKQIGETLGEVDYMLDNCIG